jgi:hypothetical protein
MTSGVAADAAMLEEGGRREERRRSLFWNVEFPDASSSPEAVHQMINIKENSRIRCIYPRLRENAADATFNADRVLIEADSLASIVREG